MVITSLGISFLLLLLPFCAGILLGGHSAGRLSSRYDRFKQYIHYFLSSSVAVLMLSVLDRNPTASSWRSMSDVRYVSVAMAAHFSSWCYDGIPGWVVI